MTLVRRSLLKSLLLFCLLIGSLVVLPTPAQAQVINPDACRTEWGGFFGLPTWYKYLLGDPATVTNPDTGIEECNIEPFRRGPNDYDYNYLLKIAFAIFEIAMRIAALAAIGFVIFGGYQFLISTGEPDKLAGARTTIVNALIGLVITLMAVAMVNLLGGSIL